MARVITADNPDLRKKFRIPHGTDQSLLGAARAFLHDIESIEAEFRSMRFQSKLLRSSGDIDSFEAAIMGRNKNTQSRVKATARLEALVADGFKLVHELDAHFQVKYRDDKPTLLAWEHASRVEHGRAHRSKQQAKIEQGKATDLVELRSSGAAGGD